MYYSLFIHSSKKKDILDATEFWIMNKAAINIHVQDFVGHMFSAPLGKYHGIWLLDHMVRVCLIL